MDKQNTSEILNDVRNVSDPIQKKILDNAVEEVCQKQEVDNTIHESSAATESNSNQEAQFMNQMNVMKHNFPKYIIMNVLIIIMR